MTPLPTKRRSELRAEAHKLSPIVIIGDKGLTDEVVAEIDRSLKAHELIKVRAAAGERDARDLWIEAICERLQAHPVQQIGKVFVLYRENPKEREERQPRGARRAESAGPTARKPGSKRSHASSFKTQASGAKPPPSRLQDRAAEAKSEIKRTSRPKSRAPSPRPESGPLRRRPRTSR